MPLIKTEKQKDNTAYSGFHIRWKGDKTMTYLGIIFFAIVILVSLILLIWIELDKKNFKDKTTKD